MTAATQRISQARLELGITIHDQLSHGDRVALKGSQVAGTVDSVDHRTGFVNCTMDNGPRARLPIDKIRVLS